MLSPILILNIFQIQTLYIYLELRSKNPILSANDLTLPGHCLFDAFLFFFLDCRYSLHNNHLCILSYRRNTYKSPSLELRRIKGGFITPKLWRSSPPLLRASAERRRKGWESHVVPPLNYQIFWKFSGFYYIKKEDLMIYPGGVAKGAKIVLPFQVC